MQLNFQVNGVNQLDRNLRLLVTNINNLNEFFKAALDIVKARTDALFAASGSIVEKAPRWAALSPKTIRARDHRWGYYRQTPNRPGVLRWTGAAQDTREEAITSTQARLSFTAKSKKGFNYPKAHQDGGPHLPQRVIVDLSNATNTALVKELQSHIERYLGIFGSQI